MVDLPALEFRGAAEFLGTVLGEVVPAVEARHHVDGARRGLAGFSFGGLFAAYTLLHRPEAFTHHLVDSPALWWDNGLPLAGEEAWSGRHDDLAAQVLFWVGSNEQLVGDSCSSVTRGGTNGFRWPSWSGWPR